MSWLSKIFNRKETGIENQDTRSSSTPSKDKIFEGLEGIRIGRYSDNNKTYKKSQSWYKAEDLFKEKKYNEAFIAFFDYLRDEAEDNVHFTNNGDSFAFDITQGSKVVHGECDGQYLIARVPLAVMETANIAVMRRLLDMNYNLYYSRAAMDEMETLYMIFDTSVTSTNASKLYYGLRELATKADRQDDLLLADFSNLKAIGTGHISRLGEKELDVKYKYFRKWIQETLDRVNGLNQDSFSGAIAYLLLGLIYRIDFLMTPEAKLLSEMERINATYWERKDELPLVERNQIMKEAVQKMLDITKEDFSLSVYHSKDTFAISTPPKPEKLKEHVISANKDSRWYIDNRYPEIALLLNEYGILYNHFIYSMPRVMTDLVSIYMAVMHADFFSELGMKTKLYNTETQQFSKEMIESASAAAVDRFKDKYKNMHWDNSRISYTSLYDFGISFSEQMANLNLETRR